MIYFTSDLHFSHINIIKYADRKFDNITEMNQILMKNWNKTLNQKDEIYILGDFTLKGKETAIELLDQLHGKKYLIKGNHDTFATDTVNGLEWIKDIHEINYQKQKFVLCHYPMMSWNKSHHGSFQLHGHIHSKPQDYNEINIQSNLRRYDVGVDANHFKPISIEEILAVYGCT